MDKSLLIVFLIFSFTTQTNMNAQKSAGKKIVIAHRGASGYLPEHTMEAKAMAYAMDCDFIEQDLALSKDDIPIVIHDIYLDEVTDVVHKFPERKREDGRYYVMDFTFEDLKKLKVSERFDRETKEAEYPNRFPSGKSNFRLHSLQDEIELIKGLNKSTGKNIGIYPEIKNPEFHRENGKDISKIVLKILSEYGYKTKEDNCILQCFDAVELKRIRTVLKSELFLTQLIGIPGQEELIPEYATYANAIGPWAKLLISGYDDNGDIIFSDLVTNAHKAGLKVHAYTFRADQLDDFSSFEDLLENAFYKAGVDGVFTDFPDKVVEFLDSEK
ncbi:MAG: glycerophosphodiester phosphodiesterase [Bacteroidota bacterium]